MSPVGSGMMLIILSDWGLQAEYLGQSLGTYTPAPSNPSSLGALQAHLNGPRMSLFGSGFELRCFQLLSNAA